MHLTRATVAKYVRSDQYPERLGRSAWPDRLRLFLPYLEARWLAGGRNAMQLLREIRTQGYAGSQSMISRWAVRLRGLGAGAG